MSDTALQTAQETIEMLIKRIAELQAEVERLREQFTCVWDHNAVTENYPCGCCGYPNGLTLNGE